MRAKVSALIEYVVSYVRTDLPQTVDDLNAWTASILRLADLADDDTYRMFVATSVLHLDARKRRASKQDMVGALKRSIASQTAYNLNQQLKAKAAADAESKAAQASPEPAGPAA